MGGNALKNTPTRRYERQEYFALANKSVQTVEGHWKVVDATDIVAYATKESFGDLDILYSTVDDVPLDIEDVKTLFQPNEIVRNSDVMSFDVEEFQVDMIHTERVYFDYASKYFAFNDLGNLIGRITKQFGLKHGHNGLLYPVRDGDTVYRELVVTANHDNTLKFVGLDPDVYNKGFDTLEDIFKFVISSPFFNPAFYKLENLNHVARIRDRKRATYNKFLEYIDGMTGDFWEPVKKHDFYLSHVYGAFPHITEEYRTAVNEIASQRYVRSKFNGDLVKELTGLTDAKLGMFMRYLKNQFWLQPQHLVLQSQEQIDERVLEEFTKGAW